MHAWINYAYRGEREEKGERGRERKGGRDGVWKKERCFIGTHFYLVSCVWGNNSDLQLIIGAGKIAQLVSAFFASMGTWIWPWETTFKSQVFLSSMIPSKIHKIIPPVDVWTRMGAFCKASLRWRASESGWLLRARELGFCGPLSGDLTQGGQS